MGATIKDVAKLAGTSTATVSKVMNGSYSISQETADKVRKAMELSLIHISPWSPLWHSLRMIMPSEKRIFQS